MARVRELMYWNMDNTARTEWANLVTSRTKSQQAQLARYAFDQHWWDLSVQATIAGKLWDQLEERFPLAYNDLFARYISGKDIRRRPSPNAAFHRRFRKSGNDADGLRH